LRTQRFSPSRLRQLREKACVSRTDLAYAVRRSEQSVWLWERGKVQPPVAIIEQIASFLGCDVQDLFEEDAAHV
jgi:DNA-binding XRE family transcriptional regulator